MRTSHIIQNNKHFFSKEKSWDSRERGSCLRNQWRHALAIIQYNLLDRQVHPTTYAGLKSSPQVTDRKLSGKSRQIVPHQLVSTVSKVSTGFHRFFRLSSPLTIHTTSRRPNTSDHVSRLHVDGVSDSSPMTTDEGL